MLHTSRDTDHAVTTLRLDHGRAQALDLELTRALVDAVGNLAHDQATRAVVLTGSGSIFSAGVDLLRVLDGGGRYLDAFLPALCDAFTALFAFPKPLVAAINGHAIAGGCVMACACDYRVMVRGTATVGVPELKVGVPFPGIAIEILRFAAPQHLEELVYFGRTYSADDAQRLGIVNELANPKMLHTRASEIAAAMAGEEPDRFRLAKQIVRAPSLERAARHAVDTDPAVFRTWKAPNTAATLRAYVQRRLKK